MEFRKLRKDEIEVRVARINQYYVSLLLYKDARCDMNILDETVGSMNWMREHRRDNANCIVSLWDEQKEQWISKEDTGTESNTEAQKGLASDSFKRACFNWGIGRELYTSPRIDFPSKDVNVKDGKTYDRFEVEHIAYEGNRISELIIKNTKNGKTLDCFAKTEVKTERKAEPKATEKQLEVLRNAYKGNNLTKLLNAQGVDKLEDITIKNASSLIGKLKEANNE